MEQNSKHVILEKLSFYKSTQPIMLFERVMRNGQSEVMFNNQNGDKVTSVIKDKITVECLKNISFFVARDKANANFPLIDAAKILHPMLLEKILYEYLKIPSRSQVIVTTHNDGLLDLVGDLIRKDSIWFTEKDKAGVTDLYKLTDLKGVNRIASIREAYRNKRFGATMGDGK